MEMERKPVGVACPLKFFLHFFFGNSDSIVYADLPKLNTQMIKVLYSLS